MLDKNRDRGPAIKKKKKKTKDSPNPKDLLFSANFKRYEPETKKSRRDGRSKKRKPLKNTRVKAVAYDSTDG